MFETPMQLEGAVITRVTHAHKDGNLATILQIEASLTPEVAETLGCRDLVFTERGLLRPGFVAVKLSTGCKEFRCKFSVEGLQRSALELGGEETGAWQVKADDSTPMVAFKMIHAGSPFETLEYLLSIGQGPAKLRIEPLQARLPLEEKKPDADDTNVTITGGGQTVTMTGRQFHRAAEKITRSKGRRGGAN